MHDLLLWMKNTMNSKIQLWCREHVQGWNHVTLKSCNSCGEVRKSIIHMYMTLGIFMSHMGCMYTVNHWIKNVFIILVWRETAALWHIHYSRHEVWEMSLTNFSRSYVSKLLGEMYLIATLERIINYLWRVHMWLNHWHMNNRIPFLFYLLINVWIFVTNTSRYVHLSSQIIQA